MTDDEKDPTHRFDNGEWEAAFNRGFNFGWISAVLGIVLFCLLLWAVHSCHAAEVERSALVQKCIIFRDADAAKVNEAVLNFLKTDPAILFIVQSESSVTPGCGHAGDPSKNILTITIFYKERP